MWGKTAKLFSGLIDEFKSKDLANPKKDVKPKVAKSIIDTDPQAAIIKSKLVRFRPTIKAYCLNYCMKRLDKDDFIHAIRVTCEKILSDCRNLGKIMLTKPAIRSIVDTIAAETDNLVSYMEEKKIGIGDTNFLISSIMDKIEWVFNNRMAMSDYDKMKEMGWKKDEQPKNTHKQEETLVGYIGKLPENVQSTIKSKLYGLGINPTDEMALRSLLKNMGIDVASVMNDLKEGRIPEKLKALI